MSEIETQDQIALEFVNAVREKLQLEKLEAIPRSTGTLASQTRLGVAWGCSVWRLREPHSTPFAMTCSQVISKALLDCGCKESLFSGYLAYKPDGPPIFEIVLPTFLWPYVTSSPVALVAAVA